MLNAGPISNREAISRTAVMLLSLLAMILYLRNGLVFIGLLIAIPGFWGLAGGFDGLPLCLMSRRRRFTLVAIGLAIVLAGILSPPN